MSNSLQEALGAEYRRQLLLLNRERIEFAYVLTLRTPLIRLADHPHCRSGKHG